jgi:RimJ/RimL family protein N-acetyltransferase
MQSVSPETAGTPFPPVLETERLVLRPWRAADSADYARILADPQVMRFLGAGWRFRAKRAAASLLAVVSDAEGRRAIERLLDHWEQHGFGEWAVEEKEHGALIGEIGLTYHPDWKADPTQVEIGWLLARSAWGRGLATEGGRAALAYAFDHVGMERVISIARVGNTRSERVMLRLGLSFVGTAFWKGGDVVWYAIDRTVWAEQRDREV